MIPDIEWFLPERSREETERSVSSFPPQTKAKRESKAVVRYGLPFFPFFAEPLGGDVDTEPVHDACTCLCEPKILLPSLGSVLLRKELFPVCVTSFKLFKCMGRGLLE